MSSWHEHFAPLWDRIRRGSWRRVRPASARFRNGDAPAHGQSRPRVTLRSEAQVSLALALVILGWQSIEVSSTFARFWNSPLWIVPHVAWTALFILLGHLVARETHKMRPRELLTRFSLRALPPLFLTVVVTAFILGPAVSASSMPNYFADAGSWNYLLNLVGWPQFRLPGVFEFNNLAETVNEPLWAIPCVALTLLVALSGSDKQLRRRLIAAATAAFLIGAGLIGGLSLARVDGRLTATALAAALGGQLGILSYELRDRFRVKAVHLAGSVIGLSVIAYLGRGGALRGAFPLSLVSILALAPVLGAATWRWPLGRLGKALVPYLGPTLIVAFPLQQLAASFRWAPRNALGNLLLTLPVIAAASLALLWASGALARLVAPALGGPSIPAPIHWRVPEAFTLSRKSRKMIAPLSVLFVVLVTITLGILAMTLFALQRNPWEN